MTDETFTSTSRVAADCAPLVSVIIPHYNDLANLKRCIDLLAAQTVPRSQFEIVVADNNSSCGLNEVEGVCGAFAREWSQRQSREQGLRATRRSQPPSATFSLSRTQTAVPPAIGWNAAWPSSPMWTQILWAAASKSMLVTRRIR